MDSIIYKIFEKACQFKKKNDILDFWREIGFLELLKEGSLKEWRCAKSYNNIAEFIVHKCNDEHLISIVCSVGLPLLRRIVCEKHKNILRPITAEEFVNSLYSTSIEECFNSYKPINKIHAYKIDCIKRFFNNECIEGELVDALVLLQDEEIYKKTRLIESAMHIDVTADVICLLVPLLKKKINQHSNGIFKTV